MNVPDYVSGALDRASKLEKLAKQYDAITWSVPAVLRENAVLIRGLHAEISALRASRDHWRELAKPSVPKEEDG